MEVIEGEGGQEKLKGNRLLKGMNSAEIAGIILCIVVVGFLIAFICVLGFGGLKWLGSKVL